MRRRLLLRALPERASLSRQVASRIATTLRVPLTEARALLERLPARLPSNLSADDSGELVAQLRGAGAQVDDEETFDASPPDCAAHPGLESSVTCSRCKRPTCVVCTALASGRRVCAECLESANRSRTFFRMRVSVLLSILLIVLMYAGVSIQKRRARTDWHRTLNVAVVVVRMGPVDPVALRMLRERASHLEQHLTNEMHRYRSSPAKAFSFVPLGPVDTLEPPPAVVSDSPTDLARHAYEQWRWLRKIDATGGIDCAAFDSCVYVVVRPPASERQWFVEGNSEQGGRIGIIEVELDRSMVDFALFVATHEMLHTLGAVDKYDPNGHTLLPLGLAEPQRLPLFPQRFSEVMARGRPVSQDVDLPPESIDELRVGAVTAEEIGWSRPTVISKYHPLCHPERSEGPPAPRCRSRQLG